MKTKLRNILSVTIILLYGFAFVGCSGSSTAPAPADGGGFALNETADEADDHDHEGEGHDHPAHGKRGGHMVEMSNGVEIEVHFDEESDLFSVYFEGLNEVSKVQMITTISDKERVYEFERNDTPGGSVYGLLDPELATAVKMGKDAAQTELRITTADGDVTAQYEHHSH